MKRTSQALLDALVAAVGDGETVAGACQRLGLSRDTVYSLKRRDPSFAAALVRAEAALRDRVTQTRPPLRVVPVDTDAPWPTRDELLRRLDEQSRSGSTRATELLLREVETGIPSQGRATADRLLGLVR